MGPPLRMTNDFSHFTYSRADTWGRPYECPTPISQTHLWACVQTVSTVFDCSMRMFLYLIRRGGPACPPFPVDIHVIVVSFIVQSIRADARIQPLRMTTHSANILVGWWRSFSPFTGSRRGPALRTITILPLFCL